MGFVAFLEATLHLVMTCFPQAKGIEVSSWQVEQLFDRLPDTEYI